AAAARLRRDATAILRANADDVARTRAAGESAAFVDRLTLTTSRIDAMARGLEEIAALPDPVGETIAAWRRPNGLEIAQVRVPIGVVLTIYESRPNVTADSAALCLKTANAVLLKGGSEAQATNAAIADALRGAVEAAGLPPAAVQLVDGGREVVRGLLGRDDRIDVVIARGGEQLKRIILEESRIPVIKHFEGICHLYVDASADLAMAERICLNAKVQRPSVCNAIENLLVHERVAPGFLPAMVAALRANRCEVRGDPATRARPHGAARAHDLQVSGARQRSGPRLVRNRGWRAGSGYSAGPSIRSTWGTCAARRRCGRHWRSTRSASCRPPRHHTGAAWRWRRPRIATGWCSSPSPTCPASAAGTSSSSARARPTRSTRCARSGRRSARRCASRSSSDSTPSANSRPGRSTPRSSRCATSSS